MSNTLYKPVRIFAQVEHVFLCLLSLFLSSSNSGYHMMSVSGSVAEGARSLLIEVSMVLVQNPVLSMPKPLCCGAGQEILFYSLSAR